MSLEKVREVKVPRGLTRRLYRAPIALYRLGLGGLLGKRFILIEHTGRVSGLTRRAVVEVLRYDAVRDEFIIASGFGEGADWYKNLIATPRASIQSGSRRVQVVANPLPVERRERELLDYGQRNPEAAKFVAKLMGYRHDGTDEDLRALGRLLPLLVLDVQDGTVPIALDPELRTSGAGP
ncbi:MAG: nitroreductase family deazaflavin-dependent oxidoreductase [bacterium]|nr:nitroreductase family deazaflavin-dependent oxidoreductase [bacterium]